MSALPRKRPDRERPLSELEVLLAASWLLLWPALIVVATALTGGCVYKGGKVTDGTNLAIGVTVPGTEWSLNVLDYVGGLRVAGAESTRIRVTNDVSETNSYFGCVETRRRTRMTADVEPLAAPQGGCADGSCSDCTIKR